MRYSSIPPLLFLLFLPLLAHAQIVQCGKTWTNQPCSEKGGIHLDEKPYEEKAKALGDHDRKRILIQSLVSSRKELERTLGVQIETSAIEEFCLERQTSLKECEEEVKSAEERLIRQGEIARLARENKESKVTKEQVTSEPQNVVIVDNRNPNFWVVHPQRRRPYHRVPRRPSLSVQVEAKGSDGSVSMSGGISSGIRRSGRDGQSGRSQQPGQSSTLGSK